MTNDQSQTTKNIEQVEEGLITLLDTLPARRLKDWVGTTLEDCGTEVLTVKLRSISAYLLAASIPRQEKLLANMAKQSTEMKVTLAKMQKQSDAMKWHSWFMLFLTIAILAATLTQIIILCVSK